MMSSQGETGKAHSGTWQHSAAGGFLQDFIDALQKPVPPIWQSRVSLATSETADPTQAFITGSGEYGISWLATIARGLCSTNACAISHPNRLATRSRANESTGLRYL